jgi:uracil-DNA glycosylase family protein
MPNRCEMVRADVVVPEDRHVSSGLKQSSNAAPAEHPATHVAPSDGLERARIVAATCTACDLYARATQTVFGEGAGRAALMLVGEQPGDREDLDGRPFVGPAGGILDRALDEAGIDRERVFVTNVVKHFKWKPTAGGKRRLHERPNRAEVRACRPWLDLEREIVRPDLVVALGATAAQAIVGPDFRITEQRGRILPELDGRPRTLATWHPSAILRARTSDDRERMLAGLVGDLVVAADDVARR